MLQAEPLAGLPLHSKTGANFPGNSRCARLHPSAVSVFSRVDFRPSSSAFFSPRLRDSASNTQPVWFL